MILAATKAAYINHDSDNQKQQINALDRLSCIHHPRVG